MSLQTVNVTARVFIMTQTFQQTPALYQVYFLTKIHIRDMMSNVPTDE